MKIHRTNPAYTGVMFVHAARTPGEQETRNRRAQAATTRFHRERKLDRKLDELLGSVDQDLPPADGDES